ncbi:hypothetical protein [Flavobacterium sp. ENC]|uniref:hypothetical protein n=1 Tax=Flavobacterium sp. ENC TaxID=2897330 RepID=UPI001E58E31B|nr:hypothetical protein [Flavobacterium sp. ENC]MCD0468066.1 hypothetical protein [Flavobacterium sp. ENC]
MKFIYLLIIIVLFQSCRYGINEKTSWICDLNTTCLEDNSWTLIMKEYSIDSIKDVKLLEKLQDFKSQPFQTNVLYFKDEPTELIGFEYYGIRYVYNSKISNQILNGLSPQLSDKEKKRIHKRIQTLLMKYQCKEGKAESKNTISEN